MSVKQVKQRHCDHISKLDGLLTSTCAKIRAMLRALLVLAVAAADSPDSGAAEPSPQCVVCELLTTSLAAALSSTKAELDGYREAKEEAIGRVQKAQTKRWLKQEYGSTLYAGVEDALDKVCALPALFRHRRTCESLREDREDLLARATLDGTAAAFCGAHVAGCDAAAMGLAAARRVASSTPDTAAATPPPRSEPLPRAGGSGKGGGGGGAVAKAVRVNWEALVLDGERDVLVYAHASSEAAGKAAHKAAPLWSPFERLARAARADSGVNATLAFARLDVAKNQIDWPEALFESGAEGCAPAIVLYPAAAKEAPRALQTSCDGSEAAAAERASVRLQLSVLTEGLRTFATATGKGEVGKLAATVLAAAQAAEHSDAPKSEL
jgi:hypothetical protein